VRLKVVHGRARALIGQRGLRQDWVAAQLGLTPDRFNHILEGRRPVPEPRDEFYAALAVLLRVRLADVREPALDPEPEVTAA